MRSWWKSPRPEIGESKLFTYPDQGFTVVEDRKAYDNLHLGHVVKGLPAMITESMDVKVKNVASYDAKFVTDIVKRWVSKP